MPPLVPILHASHGERPDESDTLIQAGSISAALERLGCATEIVSLDLDLTVLERCTTPGVALVFNLVEAIRGDSALALIVPAVLQHLGVPFTGAGAESMGMILSKLVTKQLLAAAGLPTAPWWTTGETIPEEETVIIKSITEHASWGMDGDSIVPARRAPDELLKRRARYGMDFFAERYLAGREFNIALLQRGTEVETLPIQETVFDTLEAALPAIVDYRAKWDPACPSYHQITRRFGMEQREPELARSLAALARRCWVLLDLRGYARVDLRMDAAGTAHILEVNANPCLSEDAGFAATAAAAGMSYDELIRRIVTAAVPVMRMEGN